MPQHRNLTLLFSTIICLIGCEGTLCYAQRGVNSPIYPPNAIDVVTRSPQFNQQNTGNRFAKANDYSSSQWKQASPGFDMRQPAYGSPSTTSTYHSTRIEYARRAADQYRALSTSGPPIVTELTTANASLIDQWAGLAVMINTISEQVAETNAKLESGTQEYEDVAASLKQFGLTPTLGLLLSHKKSQLDDWQVDGSTAPRVNVEIQRSREKQLENEMIEYDGSDVEQQTVKLLAAAGYASTQADHAELVSQIQPLLHERHDWLQRLAQGYNDYRQMLGELDSASNTFNKLTADYRQLVNRHVTWTRSREPLALADFNKFGAGISSLISARRSEDFGHSLSQKWSNNPASGMTLIGTTLILLLLRIFAKSWLIGIGSRKRMRDVSASIRKCTASLLTPLVAFAFPTILYLIARWLGTGYVTESTLHVSSGLYAASFVALVIEVPRQLLRRYGFVEKHLKIELPRQQRASTYLLVIGAGLVLSAYVVTLAEQIDHGSWSGSVARFGLIASLLLVAWTAHLSLKPKGGFLEPLVEQFGGKVLHRIRLLFYVLAVGFPLAMIVLSGLGFENASHEIIRRAGLMLISVLVGATLWSAIKILASRAWHALTGTHDERRFDEYDEIPRVTGALAEHSLELKHQMAFLSHCGLVLGATVAIGWLWSDVFPNVRMGNPVVWTVQNSLEQATLDANGQALTRPVIETTPITLLHLVLAGATLFVAFQLAKLLPAIFDALVLQRVSFDEAMEHLSLVLGRFVLFGTGCFIACKLVGLRWETIQWLVVGLTIGVGFALQDILRNLFGGFVVLFEKPARLGDLITVGKVTGRVAAQKLRTTVLTDEHGREVIIPNRNFVSQDVVNWMGAGRLTAITIEVAVTRDERPADICRMLQQLLVEQPELLLNPAPQATLVCVSQKWQRIELRAWVEEDQEATHYRESLMTLILSYLWEKELLAPTQPRQPLRRKSTIPDAARGYSKGKKRSA